MTQKKCPVCTQVKGKRSCLLNNNALICPQCCVQVRNSNCEPCIYYKKAQKFAVEKAQNKPKHFIARMAPEIDEQIDQALSMLNSGKISAAENLLNSLAKENSDLYTLHFALGTLYGYQQQYAKAILSFDKSLEIFPYYIESWFNRAIAAKNQLDIVEMVVSLQKVIEFGKSSDDIVIQAQKLLTIATKGFYKESGLGVQDYINSMKLFNEAFKFMQQKEWQKALVGFKKAVTINSNNAPTFGNMGLCYMNLGEHENAMAAFDRAIEIDPLYEPALINREFLKKYQKENFSLSNIPVKEVHYGKDYAPKDNNFLIDDYK